MRLFAFLFLASALMILAHYDFHGYVEAKRMVADIQALSNDTDIRGKQNTFIYRRFLNTQVNLSAYENGALAVPTLQVPRGDNSELTSMAAHNWGAIEEIGLLRTKIELSLTHFQSAFVLDQASVHPLIVDKHDVEELISDIDEAQKQNTRIAEHISNELLHSMTKAVGVNVAAMVAMVLVTSSILYRDKLRESNSNIEKSRNLEKRHADVVKSRQLSMSIMEDLASEKETAERLSRMLESSNSKIQIKNKEMERFIYTVSHDLKAPLVSIGGFSSLLIRELAEGLTQKQAHYFSRIQANVDDMESMLVDLLELSRISNSEIERTEIDTHAHIVDVVSTFEIELNKLNAEVELITPVNNVFANERLLHQCIANLISNAITYRAANKTLKITISTERCEAYTTISVRDNGIGIDEKYHDDIFNIFEHLDSDVGTGVGLTIVKTVLRKHGGEVRLKSSLGQGSEFLLSFPHDARVRRVA